MSNRQFGVMKRVRVANAIVHMVNYIFNNNK